MSTVSSLGTLNNTYDQNQDATVEEGPENTEKKISKVNTDRKSVTGKISKAENNRESIKRKISKAEADRESIKRKTKATKNDGTIDSFLYYVESSMSDKQTDVLADNTSTNRRKSKIFRQSSNDQIVCGFLKSCESSELHQISRDEDTGEKLHRNERATYEATVNKHHRDKLNK